MINGDQTNEFTSNPTSPKQFDQKPKVTNPSPDELSDYSSCGESEFERYCSANSVMGTPSLCSSVGTFNDFFDLDSSGSGNNRLGFGEDNSGRFDNGREGRKGIRRMSSNRIEKWSKSLQNAENESCSMSAAMKSEYSEYRDGSLVYSDIGNDEGSRAMKVEKNGSDCLQTFSGNSTLETLVAGTSEEVYDSFDPFGFKESESLEDEGNSCMYERSDDDGSMFNSGTDDEERRDVYNMRNLRYAQKSVRDNKDPFVVGSAVAFGSEDWDDFMQVNEENDLFSSSFDQLEEQKQNDVETEVMFSNLSSKDILSVPNIGGIEDVETLRKSLVKILANEQGYPENKIADGLSQKMGLPVEKNSLEGVNRKEYAVERQYTDIGNHKAAHSNVGDVSEDQRNSSPSTEFSGKESVQLEGQKVLVLQSSIEDDFNTTSEERSEDHLAPIKVGNIESNESYDDLVLEMEEILLDSTETPGSRFPQSNKPLKSFRDGSSTASTSGTDDAYPSVQHPIKIDGVEVIGAKQKKGDVSLGERLVGVKEYTVYKLRVWSGNDQWEIERRYRDFFTLYRQLKKLYTNHGWSLPKPWSQVEQESRKIFGNASPTIVNGRSALIQECLRSILHSETPDSVPSILNWFICPPKALSTSAPDAPTFGKTVSLLVDVQLKKSTKQLLEAQHYVCAGCHTHLNAEKTLMQTLGWGKPRLCEYTSQLFCASCHTNETAVLPARVLHFWDFTEYPVSQMAKSYLDSIYDQPMLCVSAVNPHLFSKVPALLHVMDVRKKVGAMMPFVRCRFRRSIQRGVGSRVYLLENNEFFALRDLVDLSKGVFAALPVMMEIASKKIVDHITQQCLVCCDGGVPCGAKQACEDHSSLIFPFQENEVKRCKNCDLVFHKACFEKIVYCPCSGGYKVGRSGPPDLSHQLSKESDESGLPVKFLSYLFSGKRHAKKLGSRNRSPVILMGSLPSNFDDPM